MQELVVPEFEADEIIRQITENTGLMLGSRTNTPTGIRLVFVEKSMMEAANDNKSLLVE